MTQPSPDPDFDSKTIDISQMPARPIVLGLIGAVLGFVASFVAWIILGGCGWGVDVAHMAGFTAVGTAVGLAAAFAKRRNPPHT